MILLWTLIFYIFLCSEHLNLLWIWFLHYFERCRPVSRKACHCGASGGSPWQVTNSLWCVERYWKPNPRQLEIFRMVPIPYYPQSFGTSQMKEPFDCWIFQLLKVRIWAFFQAANDFSSCFCQSESTLTTIELFRSNPLRSFCLRHATLRFLNFMVSLVTPQDRLKKLSGWSLDIYVNIMYLLYIAREHVQICTQLWFMIFIYSLYIYIYYINICNYMYILLLFVFSEPSGLDSHVYIWWYILVIIRI